MSNLIRTIVYDIWLIQICSLSTEIHIWRFHPSLNAPYYKLYTNMLYRNVVMDRNCRFDDQESDHDQ